MGTPPPPPPPQPRGNAKVSYNVLSCSAQLVSVLFFFFAGCSILSDSDLQIKKLKLHQLWRTALWLSQYCWLVLHTNFISCRVSFVLRCFYKSTPVVCAVARNGKPYCLDELWPALIVRSHWYLTINVVHAFQNTKKKIIWFHTLASKVHFCSTEGQTFYWSIMTAVDSIKCQCVNSGMTGQVGGFQNRGVCQQAFPSFLPHPLPALLLASFFARSLSLVPHSLLLNRTQTLATQATFQDTFNAS